MKRALLATVGWFSRTRNRAYLYRVITSGGAVAAAYGLVTGTDVLTVSGFVATLFGLPAANTSTKED